MSKRLSILFLCLCCIVAISHAQALRVHQLPTQPLLPVAQIHDIVQTKDGLMWYATSDGLCRDNGYQIDVFRPGKNDGGMMHNANIRNICTVRDGVAFATDEGLYIINKQTLRITRADLTKKACTGINTLIEAHDGSIWISVDKFTTHLTADLKPIKTYATTNLGSTLYEDRKHHIWSLGNNGLSMMTKDGKRFASMSWHGTSPVLMTQADKNNYWIGTFGGGIFLYNATTGKTIQQPASLTASDTRIISMKQDHNGLLWVSTMSGLDSYSTTGNRLQRLNAVTDLPQRKLIIDRLCEDTEGNMWVAGFSPTTFIISPDMYSVTRIDVSKMQDATGFFLLGDRMVADGDYYWIWQGRYGLALYNGKDALSFLWNVHPGGLANVEREFIRSNRNDGLIAYSGNTVWRVWHDGMTIKAKKVTTVKDNVSAVREDAGGRLWIATHKGLYIYLPISRMVKNVYRGDLLLLGSTIDGGGSCLFSKGTDVYKVSDNGRTSLVAKIGQEITCITTSDNGTPWVSTRNGRVFYCKDGKATECRTPSDANGNTIKQIAFDNSGCLWTLTDQTITRYNIQTNAYVRHAATDPDIDVDYFYHLEPEARGMGVSGAGAYCVLPTTDMGYKSGAAIKPFITSVSAADTTILVGSGVETVDIPADAASVSICLATGEHLYAGKVSFAWREGEHGAWTILDQGNNRAYLGSLSKGDHEIYVKATDRYGNWGEPVLCITLHRLPAWYETWWAWTIYILLSIAALSGLIYLAGRIWYLKRLQRLRNELSLKHVNIEPEDISAKRYDNAFTKKMVETIEEHLGDSTYNVEQLADDMSVSRANLFRRCKALTGKNPTNLIREIRLKAAATMLKEDREASVADISAKVGFASPSYFTKCFKDFFGVLPNQYRTN